MTGKLFLTLTVAGCCVFSFGANILKNGEFIEKNADGFATDWTIWPKKKSDAVTVRVDNTNSKSGGQSVCITHPAEKYYTRIDQLHVPCKPHTKYVARFWSKGQNIKTTLKGGARMFIGPDGDLSRPIIQFGPGIEFLRDNAQHPQNYPWTLYESNVFNSGNSKELGITLYFRHASGTVWFDNVEIEEYTSDAKKNREAERSRNLIRKDIAAVAAIAPELAADLKKVEDETAKFFPTVRDPRAGMPFFAPQRELGKIFSKHLQKKFNTNDIIISSVADPLKQQSAFLLPDGKTPETITLNGLKNEVETFALNLTNPAAQSKRIEIRLPENLELEAYYAVHVETDRQEAVDDALLPLECNEDGIYSVKIPAGMTTQIYFNAKLKYANSGVISINGKNIKVEYKPKKTLLPEKMPITLFGYAYPYHFSFIGQIAQARNLRLKSHHNGAMPYQFCSPLAYFDENGKFIPSKMNWGKLDTIISMTAPPYRLVINVPTHSPNHIREFLGTDKGTPIAAFSPEFERRLSLWLRYLVAGLEKRGITYKDFCLSLVDEPNEGQMEYIKKISALLKKLNPDVRIYNNFHHGITQKRIAEFASALDIVAPEIGEMSPDKMKILKDSGKEIWSYHVQNRSYPADKMRDFFMFMRQNDVMGFSYWCFYDRSPRWQPTGGQSYAVIYDDRNGNWQPSKRLEAYREGMEVFTILSLLKEQNEKEYKNLCAKIGNISYPELRSQALKFIK